jgi:hypothetical protein
MNSPAGKHPDSSLPLRALMPLRSNLCPAPGGEYLLGLNLCMWEQGPHQYPLNIQIEKEDGGTTTDAAVRRSDSSFSEDRLGSPIRPVVILHGSLFEEYSSHVVEPCRRQEAYVTGPVRPDGYVSHYLYPATSQTGHHSTSPHYSASQSMLRRWQQQTPLEEPYQPH